MHAQSAGNIEVGKKQSDFHLKLDENHRGMEETIATESPVKKVGTPEAADFSDR